ncbi:MAG: hypothetical protein J6K16_06940 [Alphaproteobacteria bacterium]|nr:hypothetical protein [Alphaproteobacteria bacterium]
MKFSTILSTLMVTTALTACGGGGGGGHSNIPHTTLPDVSSSNAEVTSMSNVRFSNINKAREIVEEANNQISVSFLNFKTLATSSLSEEEVFEEFGKMKDYFIDGNVFDNNGNIKLSYNDLKKYLILAGIDLETINLDNISTTDSDEERLNKWVDINFVQVQRKAQDRYRKYGNKHDTGLEDAKLNVVNIGAKQDSYVSFALDKNGKIEVLHFDVDIDSADGRQMTLDRKQGIVFSRTGDMLVYGVKLEIGNTGASRDIRLELFEKPTDINILRKMLIAALYEEKEDGSLENDANINNVDDFIASAISKINSLTLDSFNGKTEDSAQAGEAFSEGATATTKVKYETYAKGIGKKGLQYSDFGTVHIDSMEGNETVNEKFVFAGGLEGKRISKNDLQGQMEFEGKSVATVIHQDETNGERIENTKSFDGTANLVFNNGSETLTTNFDKWYNVTVTSNTNKDNYNITFSNGNGVHKNNELYKFNDKDSFTVNDFVGDKNDGSYGAVDIGYYGDNKTPQEATGFVAYGQNLSDGVDLHTQIGFGTQIVK